MSVRIYKMSFLHYTHTVHIDKEMTQTSNSHVHSDIYTESDRRAFFGTVVFSIYEYSQNFEPSHTFIFILCHISIKCMLTLNSLTENKSASVMQCQQKQ